MALYGKALANQVAASTTGYQAREMFGAMTATLADAYGQLAEYDGTGIGRWSGLDAGSVQAARDYLDGQNTMLAKYYPDMPESDVELTGQQLTELKACVSTTSVAVKTVDDLFGTSFLSDMGDSIVQAVGTVTASVANAVSKVAGSFIGGTWWVWLLAIAGAVAYKRWKRGGA